MQRIAVGLQEAAKLVGVSSFTLRRQVQSGKLKVSRVGRRVVVLLSELEKLIARGTEKQIQSE